MNANQYNNSMYTTCSNFQEDIMDPSEAVCFDPIEELILSYEDRVDEPIEEILAAEQLQNDILIFNLNDEQMLNFVEAATAYYGGVVDE